MTLIYQSTNNYFLYLINLIILFIKTPLPAKWRMTFVKRNGNVAAHGLAKIAVLSERDHTWYEQLLDYC
jgi:hypothetical protein